MAGGSTSVLLLLAVCLQGLAVGAVDVDDFDSVSRSYEFIFHDSMDLLLVVNRDYCYFLHAPDYSEAFIQQAQDRVHTQSELVSIITHQDHRVLTPTTVDAMRDKYRDPLADYHCRNHTVYEIRHALCDSEWTGYLDSCYTFVDQPLTYDEAQADCQSRGGRLAEIRSAEENAFIIRLLNPHHRLWQPRAWIGLTARGHGGQFVLPSSGQPATYTHWLHRIPQNGLLQQYCVVVLPISGLWEDSSCLARHSFVCQKW